jgi:probable HAF family extracellular repeat protein
MPLLSTPSASAAPAATDLGTLGGKYSEAIDVNDFAQAVGYSYTASGTFHAFSWTAAGGMVDLGALLGVTDSEALSVNDNGQVLILAPAPNCNVGCQDRAYLWSQAGGFVSLNVPGNTSSEVTAGRPLNSSGQAVTTNFYRTGPLNQHAILWTSTGQFTDLGATGTCQESNPYAVNDNGQVVGELQACGVQGGNGVSHPFSWTSTGGMTDLGTFGGPSSVATAVNNNGQVVGASSTVFGSVFPLDAFSWTATGGMVDLGTLGGNDTLAQGVNESGQVTGTGTLANGHQHAFSWTSSGGMVDLGTLGGSSSYASGVGPINTHGQIVGSSTTTSGASHAFAWTAAGGMVDLGTLGGTNSTADDVNSGGLVAGSADLADGTTHAVLWSVPAPPPDTDLAIGAPPANITTPATSAAGAVVTYTPPTASDEGGETPPVGCSTPSGSTFSIGTSTVTCTVSDSDDTPSSVSTSFTVTVTEAAQTIVFPAIPLHLIDAKNTPTSDPITASASSGLEVTITSSTTSVCNVANPTLSGGVTTWTVTVTAVGTCTLAADQAGNNTYQAATEVTQSFQVARRLTMGPQAMEGDLKVAPGTKLNVGYDFTIPGSHPADYVSFLGSHVDFAYTCTSGPNNGTFTVNIADATNIVDPAGSPSWYPSGNQNDPSVYQGEISVPNVCPAGALVRLQQGGTFSTGVTSTGTDTINVRWHYSANGSSGSWSGTSSVAPD